MEKQGMSNRLMYDCCASKRRESDSSMPGSYRLAEFGLSCGRYDSQFNLVDIESELLRRTRKMSKCSEKHYHPKCKMSSTCISTYSKSVPVVPVPELTPIVFSNIPKRW